MDPQAALDHVEEALSEGDVEEAAAALVDLSDWLASGGFLPAGAGERFDWLLTTALEIATL